MATSYLLGKLRSSLHARNELVLRLSDEVAQRKRAFAELERTQAQLLQAQKLEAIGQLAAGIAHDFNNTLSVVALEAELLKLRSGDPRTVARGADALLGAAERARLLTRQLLSFGRAESGKRPVVDAARVFEECAGALRRLLPSELTFELDVAPGPLPVCIHDSELHQIVLNLGINARDAMAGTGKLRVSLERVVLDAPLAAPHGVASGAYAVLTCRDTGCGMDAATLSRMFEPFFTTKGPGRGTGLGLTNVWSIVQRARGTVQVESVPGAGTTLRVFLPVSSQAPRESVEPPRLLDSHGTETVLVVEDDIRVRALVVTLLADAGYQVLDASSVDAALALEQTHLGAIDLVCTDVVMAGRPARELVSELRSRRPNTGILVCSGYSEDEQLARGIQSGEFKHLGKPFTRTALLAAVRGAIDRS
jgi:signal transduction histidine kinase